MSTIKITDTPSASECVTLAEAKIHLRVDVSDDDLLIASLITAARQDAEARMARTLVETIWEEHLDAFPACGQIRLLNPPITSITHVKYFDTNGLQQTLSPSSYVLDAASEPGQLVRAYGQSWPATYSRPGAVQIRYLAGLPITDKAKVPEIIKAWIKLRLGTLYEHREEIALGTSVAEIPFADHLLNSHKVWSM